MPLKDWDIQINYGIKTGFNEAFIIDGNKKDELINKSPKNAEIIRPLLLGKNIKRYEFDFDDNWIIFTRRGCNIEDYPVIKEHLLQFYEKLKPKKDGDREGRKPGTYRWFEIQDNVAYFKEFEKPKIAWGNLTLKAQFSYIEAGYYINAPSPFIPTDNLSLLAVLNSSISEYYIKSLGVTRNGGYFEFKPMYVEKLPIPKLNDQQSKRLTVLASKIIESKKEKRGYQEAEIDINRFLYSIYEFTNDEIEFIEKAIM